jgi:hypothetical protein
MVANSDSTAGAEHMYERNIEGEGRGGQVEWTGVPPYKSQDNSTKAQVLQTLIL